MDDVLEVRRIAEGAGQLDFAAAKRMADEEAVRSLDVPICLSWFDRAADRESPAHADECHTECEIPGDVEYAVTRGAELEVVVGDGAYIFCYRPLGEFAES